MTTQIAIRREDVSFRAMGTDIRLIGLGIAQARRWLAHFEQTLSRFRPDSELSRLNADPRAVVPAAPLLCKAVEAALWAAELTDGLVDPTLGAAVIAAGYDRTFDDLAAGAADGHGRVGTSAASDEPHRGARGCWREVFLAGDAIARPPGVLLDLGGTAKGLAADRLATAIGGVADCGGDIRVVGAQTIEGRNHTFHVTDGAIATSGIDRRRWAGGHHLIDPRTGRPAQTRFTTATALAPTALEAEARAKAALLTGDAAWLAHGGVLEPASAADDH